MIFGGGKIEPRKNETPQPDAVDRAVARADLEALRGQNAQLTARLDALELWKGQMMSLLTEESKAGRPKLSSYGRQTRGLFRR